MNREKVMRRRNGAHISVIREANVTQELGGARGPATVYIRTLDPCSSRMSVAVHDAWCSALGRGVPASHSFAIHAGKYPQPTVHPRAASLGRHREERRGHAAHISERDLVCRAIINVLDPRALAVRKHLQNHRPAGGSGCTRADGCVCSQSWSACTRAGITVQV